MPSRCVELTRTPGTVSPQGDSVLTRWLPLTVPDPRTGTPYAPPSGSCLLYSSPTQARRAGRCWGEYLSCLSSTAVGRLQWAFYQVQRDLQIQGFIIIKNTSHLPQERLDKGMLDVIKRWREREEQTKSYSPIPTRATESDHSAITGRALCGSLWLYWHHPSLPIGLFLPTSYCQSIEPNYV